MPRLFILNLQHHDIVSLGWVSVLMFYQVAGKTQKQSTKVPVNQRQSLGGEETSAPNNNGLRNHTRAAELIIMKLKPIKNWTFQRPTSSVDLLFPFHKTDDVAACFDNKKITFVGLNSVLCERRHWTMISAKSLAACACSRWLSAS